MAAITVIMGIILLWAAFSRRQGAFRRVRGITLMGIWGLVLRILYAAAGIALIAYGTGFYP
ncbi:MAG: hypothetical protein OSJ54_09025 [Oscillospiraceae bacterium]|nr:hypothetical protein [Oscillospiraceae bacterium]